MALMIYSTGQVSVENDSALVEGVDTAWLLAAITGGILTIEADGNAMVIASVQDDTHLTAATKWKGATGTYNYAIARETSTAVSVVQSQDRLTEIWSRLVASGQLGSDPGILMTWDTGTADADPGAGFIRGDSANLGAGDTLYISKTSRAGSALGNWLLGLDDADSALKGGLIVGNPLTLKQAIVEVTGVTDATNYAKVAYTLHSGDTAFGPGDLISLQFNRAGGDGNPPDASTTVKGIAELATNAETVTGTDTVRTVTPAGAAAAIAAQIAAAGAPQSYFDVYKNATQTGIVPNTSTLVTWQVEQSDAAGAFASSQYTCPRSGILVMTCNLHFSAGIVDQNQAIIFAKKNGNDFNGQLEISSAATSMGHRIVSLMPVTQGDVIGLYVEMGGSGNKTLSADGRLNRWSGFII